MLGLLFVVFPDAIAGFYASSFRRTGRVGVFGELFEGRGGAWFIRVVGVLAALVGLYWIVVGTG